MIKAIVFDFDGVLVESVNIKEEAFAALYEEEGKDVQDAVRSYHNAHGGVSRFDKIRYFEETLLSRAVTQERIDALAHDFSSIVEQRVVSCPFVAGAQEFLEEYHTVLPLFVASATPEDELKRIVEVRKMKHYFHGVLGTPAKKAEHLAYVLQKNNLKANDIVMVGDAMTDFDAARKNDVPFVGRVAQGHQSPFPAGTKTLPDLRNLAAVLGLQ